MFCTVLFDGFNTVWSQQLSLRLTLITYRIPTVGNTQLHEDLTLFFSLGFRSSISINIYSQLSKSTGGFCMFSLLMPYNTVTCQQPIPARDLGVQKNKMKTPRWRQITEDYHVHLHFGRVGKDGISSAVRGLSP